MNIYHNYSYLINGRFSWDGPMALHRPEVGLELCETKSQRQIWFWV
jgi:hypothetical protein